MENKFNLDEGIIKYFYKPKNKSAENEDSEVAEYQRLSISELLNQASDAADNNDYKKAKKLWEAASKYDDDHACYCLGICYLEGKDVEIDYYKAFEYFVKSANKGNMHAEFYLALCYEYGLGIDINYDLAFEWCQKSAEQDYMFAQYRLAYYYKLNTNLPFADNKTFFWFNKAAEQNYIPAIYMLGECYLEGAAEQRNLVRS